MNEPAVAIPTCPICGLTATELRDTGRMGCAECYRVFSVMVAQAVAVLHHVTVEPAPRAADEAPSQNPWPTRRAQVSPPTPRR